MAIWGNKTHHLQVRHTICRIVFKSSQSSGYIVFFLLRAGKSEAVRRKLSSRRCDTPPDVKDAPWSRFRDIQTGNHRLQWCHGRRHRKDRQAPPSLASIQPADAADRGHGFGRSARLGRLEKGQVRRERATIAWVQEMGGRIASPPGVRPVVRSWWEKTTDRRLRERVWGVSFRNTQVSDLSPLAELKNLVWLDLSDTQVSDLSPLAELRNLEVVRLNNTQVSDKQVQELRQAHPNCEIYYPISAEK